MCPFVFENVGFHWRSVQKGPLFWLSVGYAIFQAFLFCQTHIRQLVSSEISSKLLQPSVLKCYVADVGQDSLARLKLSPLKFVPVCRGPGHLGTSPASAESSETRLISCGVLVTY